MRMAHAAMLAQRQPSAGGLQLLLALRVVLPAFQALRGALVRLGHGAVALNVLAGVLVQRWCGGTWRVPGCVGSRLRPERAGASGQAQGYGGALDGGVAKHGFSLFGKLVVFGVWRLLYQLCCRP